MGKMIAGLLSMVLMAFVLAVPAHAAPVKAAPVQSVSQAVQGPITLAARATGKKCGPLRYTRDTADFGEAYAQVTTYYKVCKNLRTKNKWVRAQSMTYFAEADGGFGLCSFANTYMGFKFTVWFNDLNGHNFRKKATLDCETNRTSVKYVDLTNQPRLTTVQGGAARWHGTATKRNRVGFDNSKSLSGYFGTGIK